MISAFKEASGQWSMRRLLAFLAFWAAVAGLVLLPIFKASTWYAYALAGGFLVFSLALLLFTTWADIKAIVSAIKGEK